MVEEIIVMNEEKLLSERLTFRRWNEDDAEKVVEIHQNPKVYRFIGNPPAPMKDIQGNAQQHCNTALFLLNNYISYFPVFMNS